VGVESRKTDVVRLVVSAAYLINTSSKDDAGFTLNGSGAGFALAAAYGDRTKFHFTTPTVNAPLSPPTIMAPGTDNIITVWGQTYNLPLIERPNTGEELRLFFFANQLVVVDSYWGVIKVVAPTPTPSDLN
jgi:hypothetical protein